MMVLMMVLLVMMRATSVKRIIIIQMHIAMKRINNPQIQFRLLSRCTHHTQFSQRILFLLLRHSRRARLWVTRAAARGGRRSARQSFGFVKSLQFNRTSYRRRWRTR